jgi:hypothetical protein
LYTNGLRDTPDRKSDTTEVAAALAFGAGATCAHINLSMTFLNVFAMFVPYVIRLRTAACHAAILPPLTNI